MLDVIICANFGVEKLKGFGNTRGQILEFSIEMAGHPYNSAALPRSLWWEIQKFDPSQNQNPWPDWDKIGYDWKPQYTAERRRTPQDTAGHFE